ncbi:MAG: hypothetical protein ACE145_13300 [Terriglobia bacterium]
MTSFRKFRGLLVLFFLSSIFLVTAAPPTAQAQDVIVTQAIPDQAPQGMVSLNVQVKGNGFKKGAIAKWLVTGSETDTGGVTVNSTAFVNSNELLANITIAGEAQTEKKYDIKVTLTGGRTGKGIELFSVIKKGSTGCTAPTPILAAPWSCLLPGASGCQDTTFGNDGLVITNTSGSLPTMNDIDIAKAVAIQSDGKLIVAGGSRDTAGLNNMAVVRYTPDGTLDLSFGTNGITRLYDPYAWARTVAIQSDGKIIMAGGSRIARLNPDGTFDTSFGSGGVVVTTFPSGRKGKPGQMLDMSISEFVIQSDGKIVLVGTTSWIGWAIQRLNPGGTLDPTFGTGGRFAPQVNGGSVAAVALQRVQVGEAIEEWILAGGSLMPTSWPNEDNDFGVMRLTPSGSLDTTFGPSGTGMTMTDFCGNTDHIEGLAQDAAGNIIAGGVSNLGGPWNYAVARYSPNGILDATYGDPDSGTNQPGRTIVSLMAGDSNPHGLLLQTDGKAIVTGSAANQNYFGLVRFHIDGTLDTTFGSGGVVVTDFGPGGEYAYKGVIQSDGKIVVVGTVDTNGTGYNFGAARYWP